MTSTPFFDQSTHPEPGKVRSTTERLDGTVALRDRGLERNRRRHGRHAGGERCNRGVARRGERTASTSSPLPSATRVVPRWCWSRT